MGGDWKHDLREDSLVHFSGKVESYNNSMDNFFNGTVMYLCGQFFKFGGWILKVETWLN